MAITLTYGPISGAMQLGRMAGAGEDFWRRFQAEQQVLDRLDRQAAQSMQLRGMRISEAQAAQQMAMQQRRDQEQAAMNRVSQAMAQRRQDQADAMAASELGLSRRRQALAERKQGFAEEQAPLDRELALMRLQGRGGEEKPFDPTKTPGFRVSEARIGNLQDALRSAFQESQQYTDEDMVGRQIITDEEKYNAAMSKVAQIRTQLEGEMAQQRQLLSGVMPAQQFQPAGVPAPVQGQAPAQGGAGPQPAQVTLGGQAVQLPAPPPEAAPPSPGAPLSSSPEANDMLIEIVLNAAGNANASPDEIDAAFLQYIQAQGWSPN